MSSPKTILSRTILPNICTSSLYVLDQDVVKPQDEALKLGYDNLKLCVLGIFAKGTLPFSKVPAVAFKIE